MKRTAAFIDGPNFHAAAKGLMADIDYRLLITWMRNGCPTESRSPVDPVDLVRATYYTSIRSEEDTEFSSIRPLIDWLNYNGYALSTKPARPFTDATGRQKWKGNMHVEFTCDVVRAAREWRIDEIVLFSGDGDLTPLVAEVQDLGLRVIVVSELVAMRPPMVSDDLRRQADEMINISEILHVIGRDRQPSGAVDRRNRHVGGSV